ncbi:uncharacterized protein A1O9_04465 [Exophiala aquamarina CBS 119918]|uniref:Checkpoint protein RAD24-like helical bundle domain-containing protein n=1 Tax=Exophiala aquamarina CBS 119918 TaxID=1182545 RepID=A0A072PHJ8_9EURO|nr:uncharacterized protein A1O9_04465 [Exophiala aquamarina CBS 119918]KEF59619.1 hypothetical protein A1O9_04465 [Exophiala aquamarina CBS 119918]
MASRPAKRQRRSTIVLSDDDEELELPSPQSPVNARVQREITLDGRTSLDLSPARAGKGKSSSRRPAPKPSPKSSPAKAKKNTRAQKAPEKTKSLHTFFTKATEEQRWKKRSETPDIVADLQNGEIGDAIEDDDLSDDTLQELGLRTDKANTSLQDSRKPAPANSRNGLSNNSLSSTQRFVKGPAPRDTVKIKVEDQDQDQAFTESRRPWGDRYGPANLEELVVHKKKVADVQGWLQGKCTGRHSQKLLVLKGPAGSGKTTTVSLLAKLMALDLVSWHNPMVADSGPTNSIAVQFDEFLNRGGQFGGLTFNGEDVGSPSEKSTNGRILLIEEFPATITRSSSTLQSFRSVLLRYLARPSHSHPIAIRGQQAERDNSPPVVIIISETLLSSSTALADSFTAHRLLGPEILNHAYVTSMDFNPVAPTFVTKALDLVVKKEARDSGRRRMPGPAIMQRLAEMSDVRSAVNALEFLCVRTGDGSEWSGTISAKSKKTSRNKETVTLTDLEKKSLQLLSHRETTLDMFHATGKIVYNKRQDPRVQDTRAEPPPKPPDHLMHLYSPKASLVDIEVLLNETGTDIQTFISTLHENYILSCNGDTFEPAFDGCSDALSTSDILNPDSRPYRRANNNPNAGFIQSNLQSGSSDTLRQDEISFHAATRGLLFNLPYPVNRASVPGGKRGDNFKMFYPQSLRLWKPTEEIESLVELFVHGTDIDHTDSRTFDSVIHGVDGGVASWQSRAFMASRSISKDGEDDDKMPPSQQVRYNKDVLTLEILPYTTRIRSWRKEDVKTLNRITQFKPNAYLPNLSEVEESYENGLDAKDPWPQQKRPTTTTVPSSPSRRGIIGSPVKPGPLGLKLSADLNSGLPSAAPPIEKLYLDDDDIVDD